MTVIPITCDNCGAKYKLPPTFKGSQAKCQKCGSVIDVAKQRDAADGDDASPAAAAKPAAARPAARPAAAAKPAVDRSKGRSKPAAGASRRGKAADDDEAKPARSARGGSRSRRGASDDDGDATRRRGREKKKDNTPMILGGVGLVAILIVVGVLMMKGDDKKKTDENAEGGKAAVKAAATDGGAKVADGSGDASKPADADTKSSEAKPADAGKGDEMPKPDAGKPEAGKPEAGKPAEGAPAEGGVPMPSDTDPTRKKERWEKQRNPARSMGDVRSAADQYGEVQWPESIDAATKSEVMSLVEDLDPLGGIRSTRAKNKLVKMGYPGLFGILERLRTLDYTIADDGLYGFELNKALENMTGGLTASYVPVNAGEELHPAKAQWNTKNVGAWMKAFARWPDAAAFKKAKVARAKKKG